MKAGRTFRRSSSRRSSKAFSLADIVIGDQEIPVFPSVLFRKAVKCQPIPLPLVFS